MKRLPGKLIRLTKQERLIIRHALRIAAEDSSIYEWISGADEYAAITKIIEKMEVK